MRSPKDRVRGRTRRPRMRGRLSDSSFNRMVPNVLTLLALCAGMTAIRFAFSGDFQYAVFAIIAAGIFDGLDGRLARLLKATSQFGAELDSLADFISFGVAPAAVLYLWTMSALHSIGWAIVLFYAVCCALRLARFNTQLVTETPPRMGRLDRALALPQRGVDQRRRPDDDQQSADGLVEAHPDPASVCDTDPARHRNHGGVFHHRAVADPDVCRGALPRIDPADNPRRSPGTPCRRGAPGGGTRDRAAAAGRRNRSAPPSHAAGERMAALTGDVSWQHPDPRNADGSARAQAQLHATSSAAIGITRSRAAPAP